MKVLVDPVNSARDSEKNAFTGKRTSQMEAKFTIS